MDPTGTPLLTRLLGKKFVFEGKFGYGDSERKGLIARVTAQGGEVVDELDATVNYLVIADLEQSKKPQKTAEKLNASGAAIQIIQSTKVFELSKITDEEYIAVLQAGQRGRAFIEELRAARITPFGASQTPFHNQKYDNVDLSGHKLEYAEFKNTRFYQSTLHDLHAHLVDWCNLMKCKGANVTFTVARNCRFAEADLPGLKIHHLTDCDFTSANLESATLGNSLGASAANCIFTGANLRNATLGELANPKLDQADMTGARFKNCVLSGADLRGAKLQNAVLVGIDLSKADFRNADLRGANLARANLTGAQFDNSDLTGANLRGAILTHTDFSKAQIDLSAATTTKNPGPACAEFSAAVAASKRVQIVIGFHDTRPGKDEMVHIDAIANSNVGILYPEWLHATISQSEPSMVEALQQLATISGHRRVRLESISVKTTDCPKPDDEMSTLAVNAIAEIFGEFLPAPEQLAALAKAFRAQERKARAAIVQAEKDAKDQAKKATEEAIKAKTENIEKKIGKIADLPTFIKALEHRIDKARLGRSIAMLKAEGFALFNEVSDTRVSGIVKSQRTEGLHYGCWLDATGKYGCCSADMAACMGLRGEVCKHILVLVIGLVQEGVLDAKLMDEWIARSKTVRASGAKGPLAEILLKYKLTEAGEVDWRPTHTTPEDYYSV